MKCIFCNVPLTEEEITRSGTICANCDSIPLKSLITDPIAPDFEGALLEIIKTLGLNVHPSRIVNEILEKHRIPPIAGCE